MEIGACSTPHSRRLLKSTSKTKKTSMHAGLRPKLPGTWSGLKLKKSSWWPRRNQSPNWTSRFSLERPSLLVQPSKLRERTTRNFSQFCITKKTRTRHTLGFRGSWSHQRIARISLWRLRTVWSERRHVTKVMHKNQCNRKRVTNQRLLLGHRAIC